MALGSAWQWDEETEEYYLHLYLPGQPDLNWENVEMRHTVYNMMRWWLEKGVCGFRVSWVRTASRAGSVPIALVQMDVINLISKPDGLPDVPVQEAGGSAWPLNCVNGPRVHEYLQEMNREVLASAYRVTATQFISPNPTQNFQSMTPSLSGRHPGHTTLPNLLVM